jgi:NitT/TauT family transport system substrate-binding protein
LNLQRTLAVLGLISAALLLPASSRAAATLPVTLGVVNWIGYGPLYCAAAKGYYSRRGSDVRLVTFSDNSLMSGALEGGELDASTLTYDEVILADARGWNLKVVMPVDYSTGGDAILASSAVHTVRDLRGRKVAFQPLSPSDFLLGYALAQAGLSEKDIQPVSSTPEDVPGMMASGAVDAGVTYEPSVSMILGLGGGKEYHVLLSSRAARGMITDVLAVRAETIAKNPAMVDALVRGTMDGLAFMQAQPSEAARIIASALGITPAQVKAQLADIENPPPSALGEVFRDTDILPSFRASGQVIGRILESEGQIRALPPIAATFDSRFVDALQASTRDRK